MRKPRKRGRKPAQDLGPTISIDQWNGAGQPGNYVLMPGNFMQRLAQKVKPSSAGTKPMGGRKARESLCKPQVTREERVCAQLAIESLRRKRELRKVVSQLKRQQKALASGQATKGPQVAILLADRGDLGKSHFIDGEVGAALAPELRRNQK